MPRRRNNPVSLSKDDRGRLEGLIGSGHAPARRLTDARILLKADEGARMSPDQWTSWPDTKIADALQISRSTVSRVRQRFVREGLEAALVHRRPKATKPKKLDGEQEAHLIALACSAPPKGEKRWSVRLLAERFVELECARGAHLPRAREAHSEKSAIKPWLERTVVHPAEAGRLLRLAHGRTFWRSIPAPTTSARPQVCLDEKSKQLLAEVREPLAVLPGAASPSRLRVRA